VSGVAKAQVLGRLGRDPELRFMPDGTAKCVFSLAVSHQKKDAKGDWVESEPTWIEVVIWGKRGESFARFHSKGDLAFVAGDLRLDTWESKSGEKRSKLYVNAQEWEFAGEKKAARGEAASGSHPDKMFTEPKVDDKDTAF